MGPFLEAGETRDKNQMRGNIVRPGNIEEVSSENTPNKGNILGVSDDEDEGEEGEKAKGVKIPNVSQ